MKNIFLLLLFFSIGANAADFESDAKQKSKDHSCPMKSDEKLICANVMCDFGLIMGEWSDECKQYKKDLAIYLATLGFWDKPPKCFARDSTCKKDGKVKKNTVATTVCEDEAGNIDENCLKGVNVVNSECDELTGKEHDQCYVELAKANGECEKLSGESKLKCLGIDGEMFAAQGYLKANSYCKSLDEYASDPAKLEACINTIGAENARNECKKFTGDPYILCMNSVETAIKNM